MAIRWCGKIKINCKLMPAKNMPHGEQYRCAISHNSKYLGTEWVGLPKILSHGTDSPKAYDDAAHAALSFATHKGEGGGLFGDEINENCDYSSSSYLIRRSKGYSARDRHLALAGGR